MPALLIVAVMAGFAVSELMISPIGLAVTTQLAPKAFRAQMMALYFFSVGLGTSMSGVLARYYDPARELAYFGLLGMVAIVVRPGRAGVHRTHQPADGGRALDSRLQARQLRGQGFRFSNTGPRVDNPSPVTSA